MKKVISSKWIVLFYFILAWLLLAIIYGSGHRAMLVDDGINGLLVLQKNGINGFTDSYGTNCFYYSFWTFLWLLYLICGTNTILWFLFFSMMHAINAVLIFIFFKKFYAHFSGILNGETIAFLGSLFFLFSPFMSENLMWTATHHYAISSILLLILLTMTLDFFKSPFSIWQRLLYYSLFCVSITTHEISFFFPLVITVLYLSVYNSKENKLPSLVHFFKTILLPLGSVCILYLLALHHLRGIWVPHYYPNEVQILASDSVVHFFQYHFRFLLFAHHWPNELREKVYQVAQHWQIGIVVYSLLLGLVILSLYRFKRLYLKPFLFLVIASILLLLPVLQVPFMYLFKYECDRYLYFFSIFIYQGIVFFVFLFSKPIQGILSLSYLVMILFLTFGVAKDKVIAANYLSHYMDSFEDKENTRTFIFNSPTTIQHQRVFYYQDGFTELYKLIHNHDISQRVFPIMGVVGYTENNTIDSKRLSDSSVQFQLKSDGEWFYMNTFGGSSYEHQAYSCNVDPNSVLTLKIRNSRPIDRILKFESGQWIEVK